VPEPFRLNSSSFKSAMIKTDTYHIASTPSPSVTENPRVRTPEEAAERFEEVMIQQFVGVMLQKAFDAGLDTGTPAWVKTQRATQLDTLSETLASALAQQKLFHLSDTLLRQWKQAGLLPSSPPPSNPETHETGSHS